MSFLLRTLSLSYVRRHRVQTLLTLLGVATGVATFASIRAAQHTLVSGLQTTVDRVAGRAHLQITGVSGVAEEVFERLIDVAGVEAQAPVIEQVVQAGGDRSMSLLLLGVDLLGDRRMREYGFEGEDADVDDPLEFLAQPDSIALAQTFADRAGLKKGDVFEIQNGPVRRRLIVRGLLEPEGFAAAFAGNLGVTDVYAAQELLGRGRRFDRIDVRLQPGVTLDDGAAAIARAVGPGYRVETPERRGVEMDRLITTFVGAFDVSSLLALGMGAFLIFNTLTVAVDRRRRDIGILRAIGATPRQIQGLFLCEALALGAVGGAAGLLASEALAEWFLDIMGRAAAASYGLDTQGDASLDLRVAALSLALGGVASLVGAWRPARMAALVPPTQALAPGVYRRRAAVGSRRGLAAGVVLALFCAAIALGAPVGRSSLMGLVLLTGMTAVVLLAGPLANRLLKGASRLLDRLAPVAGRLAADAMLSQPRRLAGTTASVALSLAFVLGAGGYLHSTKTALNRWVDDVMTADLMVRGSLSLTPSRQRLPDTLRAAILEETDVAAVDAYRTDWVTFRGEPAVLLSIETDAVLDRTRQEFVRGTAEQMRRGLVEGGASAMSENLARLHGLDLNGIVELDSPTGRVRLPIAAIVTSYMSDRGVIIADRAFFREHWQDDRVDGFHVSVQPGADAARVREALAARLSRETPVLISTREEFVDEINRALDGFYALTRLTVAMALVVAFVGIATSLLISVVERAREIGIMRALGAVPAQVKQTVVLEALAIAGCGLVLAVPIGALLARFLETIVAESYSGFRMPGAYPVGLLVQILGGLPVLAAAAAWLPARQASALAVAQSISHE